jgi:protein-disulfide isomerase
VTPFPVPIDYITLSRYGDRRKPHRTLCQPTRKFVIKPAIARFRRAAAVAAIAAALPAAMAITMTAGAPVAANAQSGGNTGVSAAHKAEFEKIVRDYILRNPEIVAEAIQILRAKKKVAEATADKEYLASNRATLISDPASPVGGNPKGDVTIVEFFDYRCGVCKRIHPIVDELVRTDKNIRRV